MIFLDNILLPLLGINPFLAIFIISLILSVMITVIYKFMTDQELMKTLKEDMKSLQKEMKQLKDNPEKMLSVQKQAMEKNMKYMMQSMKPTLITFIPIILVFGWLNSHFAYLPIQSGQEFNIDVMLNNNVYGQIEAKVPNIENTIILLEQDPIKQINSKVISYKFKALSEGEWDIVFVVNDKEYVKSVKIDPKAYAPPVQTKFEGKDVKEIKVSNEKRTVLNLFGFKLGWLLTYIVLSIVFSISLRKILKLH